MQQPTSIPNDFTPDLHSAFTSVDPTSEPATALDPALLQIIPSLPPLDFDQLEYEVAAQRRIFIQGDAAIPVAGIIAVGGALFFHATLLGLFFLAYHYMPRVPIAGGGGGEGAPDFGGSRSAYMIDDADSRTIPTALAAVQPTPASVQPTPAVAARPPVPAPPPPLQIASAVPPPSPIDPVIGVSGGQDPTPPAHPAPPPRVPDPTPPVTGLPIAAPPTNPVLASPVTPAPSANPAGAAHAHVGPARPGADDGNDAGDEETIDLSANGSGLGTGSGKHRGAGVDRGASGANNETPAVLDAPAFKLWADYLYHPPKKRVILSVNVLADGTAGEISIVQSSGARDVDVAYKSHVALHYRFRPAYREGRPFAAAIQCSQSFGTDDE